ncbi:MULTISPECIES: AAA family ATPase [Pseudonocardia]|uniref:AAA family ATPase n=1 Tax=Pseudonocardia TaxID=1847 RepID=UPI000A28A2FE|nr:MULTISPECIES: AAA family ATPase [Pseudonocardia]
MRRVEILRFRGIRELVWALPAPSPFVALIGPGDACKTTILTAIQRALSDTWQLTFQDSDFFGGEVDEPIVIRVAVTDLDEDLLGRDVAGMHLCGITATGELHHDPADGDEPCVVVELRVEADLEPRWTFFRPGDAGEPTPIRTSVRSKFRAFRVDDRIDGHLRWSRTSALGKLTEAHHGTREVLIGAQRTARRAVAESVGDELQALTTTVQGHIVDNGSGTFQALRPGLDTSLSQSHGNLALHEGEIPLTSYGLGTRRLTGVSVQQLTHPGKSILLVDELEHGLEPHRVIHLADRLRFSGASAQTIVTTHSPIALQHLHASDLVRVRCRDDGTVETERLGTNLQSTLRTHPGAFLARHVLVAEGKTELGIAMQLRDRWDAERQKDDPPRPPAAALGVYAIEGGGSQAVGRVRDLRRAGYEVTFFLDADRADTNDHADELEAAGVRIVRWPEGYNTEQVVCAHLTWTGLSDLIDLARAIMLDAGADNDTVENTLRTRLIKHLPATVTDPLNTATWAGSGLDLDSARDAVANAATDSKDGKAWFKIIEAGKRLGAMLLDHRDLAESEALQQLITDLKDAIYCDRTGTEEGPVSAGPVATAVSRQ